MSYFFHNFHKNQKGFTLVEILVVISIIAILFVTLLPQIDFAGDKSRQTGVKTDFRTLQTATEAYMRETNANEIHDDALKSFLDKGMKPNSNANGSTNPFGLDLAKKDPWGHYYDLFVYQVDQAIVYKSFGKDGVQGGTDNFYLAVYYDKGEIVSCTSGFETNNISTNRISETDCGLKKLDGSNFSNVLHNPITF